MVGPQPARDSERTNRSEPQNQLILIVHPDPSVRKSLRSFLIDAGYDVSAARSATSGKALFDRASGVCVLLLVGTRLPEMPGVEFAEQLKDRAPKLKVIYLFDERDRIRIRGPLDDSSDGIEPPVRAATLYQKVRQLLST
jgi:two-component system, cell cycle sensor histidine kinase and response regulator CckA